MFKAELGKKSPSESRDIKQENVLRALRVSQPEVTEFLEILSNNWFFLTEQVHLLRQNFFVEEIPRSIVKPQVWGWECSGKDSQRDLLMKSIPGWVLASPAAQTPPPSPRVLQEQKHHWKTWMCIHEGKKSSFPPLFLRIIPWL